MQGYRGDNRLGYARTPPGRGRLYLIVLWLFCSPGLVMAQTPGNSELTWYIPKLSIARFAGGNHIIEYASFTDLAEKLAQRSGKPYHLSLDLTINKAVDWQALRTIPPASSLAIQLADSVMSDSLFPILATWPSLEKMSVTAVISFNRSFTLVTDPKDGKTVFGQPPRLKKLPQSGWAMLATLRYLTLNGEFDYEQAIAALQDIPALESLTIQPFSRDQDAPAALAGMSKLKRLSLSGISRKFAEALKGMPNLIHLSVSEPFVPDLNAGLTYLTQLESLEYSGHQPGELRLGILSSLQRLYIQGRTNSRLQGKPANMTIPLDSVLAGLTTLKSLSLEHLKISVFPASLLANRGLTCLSMPDVNLTDLPNNLDQLAALEELILDNNPLHQLPNAVCRLPRLRRLSLSRCELDSLPANIGQLTSLTSLALNTNQLTSLPKSIGQLKQLRQLNVAMNQLTALPDELGTLPHLETIAAFWNKIARFPVGFTQVRELYLTDNQLTELPASLGALKRLRTLLIDNNLITTLPEQIGQLDSLETLVIGGNRLTMLPKTIGSLRRLTRFTLGINQIRELPETIGGLISLTSVTVSDNPITLLPASIGAWQRVNTVSIRLPQLESLPEQIGQWQALQILTVESDRLVTVPNELADCKQLTYLAMTGRRLLGLPESLGKLSQLAEISLDGRADSLTGQGRGQVIALPASLANCKELTRLSILNQQQFDGVEGMQVAAKLPDLKHLTFVNCGITELSGIRWKDLLVSTLNLSQNRFSELPAAVLDMPNMEQVNFSETNLPTHLNRFFHGKMELTAALKKQAE